MRRSKIILPQFRHDCFFPQRLIMKRREILKAGVLTAFAASFSGTLAWSGRVEAATHPINVLAERIARPASPNSSSVLPFWRYRDAATGQQSQINVLTGDTVVINLTNSLPVPVNLVIPGLLDDAPACPPGGSISFSFIAPDNPGTYVFFDNRNGSIGRAMGLGGALIVRPRDGINRLYNGGPGFNREHLAVFQEIDSRLNLAVDSGAVFDITNFEPNYYYVNDIAYTQGGGVEFLMGLGENVAIRFVNPGLIYYPMHFHGYHVRVATRNRTPETFIVEKDTVSVRPGEVVEAILPVGLQSGLYPLHSHHVPAVTNNGEYAGGGLIMLNAS